MGAMEVSGSSADAAPEAALGLRGRVAEPAERAARRTLRAQIARLERELANAFVTAYPMGGSRSAPSDVRGAADARPR